MKQKTPSQLATEELYMLAIRPTGVKQYEEYVVYKKHFGSEVDDETGYARVNITASQKSYVRKKVRELASSVNKKAIFVPDWLSTDSPKTSWDDMLSMTNEMYSRMQEYVNDYMFKHDLPSSARYAVEQQLFVLLVPGYSPRSVYDNTSLISEVVNDLEANNPTHKISTRPPVKMECMKDIEHFIY